jgi:putative glutamine transport system substrate-binding protein
MALAMLALLAVTSTSSAGTSDTMERIKARGRLIVGTEPKFALFATRDPASGTYRGFMIDVAKALARAMLGDASRLEIRPLKGDERLRAVTSGEIDMVIDTTGPVVTNPNGSSAAKNEIVDFSDEIYNSGSALLVKRGSPIRSIEDITPDTRVLYIRANPDWPRVQARAPRASYVGFDDTDQAFEALRDGRGDVLVQVDTRLYELAHRDPSYVLVGKFTNRPDAIMIKKGDAALRDYLNTFIRSLRSTGEYDRLYRSWFKIAESQWRVP